ncbi:circadian clock protein KaiC [Methanothermobacter marburgensis]|uniref:non-specific serine/threonine protein kinase n=1 Tax=Methanothermobacter marburgensis (strain ATCC BAA-927 / DSM 2133 / JCM 14651 / NBRC 100331 / OCM 82 / Marburg) TaxID=79929 RepID=D9PXV8_METTM|nr:circadian clock protein KaiC [Methanothermobacter marburgensis]ADL59056.1 KaiC-related protein [Methanothermobacter marburgensis str. Marburg]WBF09582.1 circadian clock protein KaiC [Methanothermobacter marburgensis]
MRFRSIEKSPTGIKGLDMVTGGGFPQGRNTLIYGGPGTGKTFIAVEFLLNGASYYGEHGVLVSFDEPADNIVENFQTDDRILEKLIKDGKIFIEDVSGAPDPSIGSYSLDALKIRIEDAVKTTGASRVVLDKVDSLFDGVSDRGPLHMELRHLISWLNGMGVTSVFTAGDSGGKPTHGLEDYISDCVIHLTHTFDGEVGTRHMRIVKYRGSSHGLNRYPFLINERGISIFPITSLKLDYSVSRELVSTGIPDLDDMLGGGVYRGSSVLISGTTGAGKTTVLSKFAYEACRRGERCLYFANEEPADQIIRNMESVGIQLKDHTDDKLMIHSDRPTSLGLESHLTEMQDLVMDFKPDTVLVDPVTGLAAAGGPSNRVSNAKNLFIRFTDFLKSRGVTSLFTYLIRSPVTATQTELEISSLIDTWIVLEHVRTNGDYKRLLRILKSRGMDHSSSVAELKFTERGILIKGGSW